MKVEAQDWLLNERKQFGHAAKSVLAAMQEADVQIRELKERIKYLERENKKLSQMRK